jgi:hypothetical protein
MFNNWWIAPQGWVAASAAAAAAASAADAQEEHKKVGSVV